VRAGLLQPFTNRMDTYTKCVQNLIEEFERLPGIGRKTAERLAYFVLRSSSDDAMSLARAIRDVKQKVRHCKDCFHVTESELCEICSDPARDCSTICIVEQPKDLYSIEASGSYRGLYHVLLGSYAPLDGTQPADLTFQPLMRRLRGDEVREVIVATNPNFEGEGTALYLREQLQTFRNLKVTRIARGVPSGTRLEHASKNIVADALEGRREMES